MGDIDSGHQALDAIIRRAGNLNLADANEAETRLKIIDEMVRVALGWQLEDISVEERVVGETHASFCDYVLRTASTSIVVEAKRVGAAFLLPNDRTSLRLGGVLSGGELGEAIRQARGYCTSKSIPFAVVTNGSAWVIFPAVRIDQVSFERSEAQIFRSLADVKTRFVQFWELLSRQRVADGNLEDALLGRSEEKVFARCVRNLLPEPGYRIGRNAMYDHIEPGIAAALTDEALLSDVEALSHCYVKTSERHKYDTRLRMYLHDPRPALGQTSERLTDRAESNAFRSAVLQEVVTPPRFIVLLGPVGAGKTTFLGYTHSVSAAKDIAGKVLWITIDFKRTTSSKGARSFVYEELLRHIDADVEFDLGDWEKSIRPAYVDQVRVLRRGVLKPLADRDSDAFELKVAALIQEERTAREPYVERILQHSASKRPTYLVFDNIDHVENESYQGEVFVEAQALVHRVGANGIICLRESTFLRHRNTPRFNAFQFDLFYLDAPAVAAVLSRRFSYAKRVLKGRAVELSTEGGIRLQVPDLGEFFHLLGKSLLAERSGAMLEALSGGNIRRGLMLVRDFLASGHTMADRAIAASVAGEDYRFPLHEVFRGVVLGNRRYYDDTTSLVPNIFDAKLGRKGLQLLRLRLVLRLVDASSVAGFEGLPASELRETYLQAGVSGGDIDTLLEVLLAKSLVRTTDGLALREDSCLVPTRLAGYLLRVAAREFAYNEFCSCDTVIFDDATWERLQEGTREIRPDVDRVRRLEARIRRLRIFLDYLVRREEEWVVLAKRRRLGSEWEGAPVALEVVPAVEAELPKMLESARRVYGAGGE